MKSLSKSLLTAGLLFAAVVFFSVRHIAPALPPFVGPPDYRETRELQLPSAGHLVIDNEDGAVRIRTSPDGGVSIRADIRLYGGGGVDGVALADYAAGLVHTTHAQDRLEIISEPEDRFEGIILAIAYDIAVPEGTDVDIIGSNGNINVAEGCGRVAVYGGNADIEIVEPQGIVIAKSANGRIKLVNARHDATLEAVNGSIFADMQAGALDATTTNGNVIARLLDPEVSRCDLVSQNGAITIELSFGKFTYDLKTDRGFIRSDFDLEGGVERGVLEVKQIEGTHEGGGAVLMADALNGNIWLKRNRQWQ